MTDGIGFIGEDYAAAQTRGKRPYQEDDFDVVLGLRSESASPGPVADILAVLADGMGGENAGDVASATAVRAFVQGYRSGARGAAARRLSRSLDSANTAIAEAVLRDEQLTGMGCTLVALQVEGGLANWISVGDSPLWRIRGGQLDRLNEDHSYGGMLDEMVRQGRLEAEAAANSRRRNLLISAITGAPINRISQSHESLAVEPGDWFLLASDGLLSLQEDEILAAAASADSPRELAQALIRAVDAKDLRTQDNATVQVVRCLGRSVPSVSWWQRLGAGR